MRYLSLFSGIGGFELGIESAYREYINALPEGTKGPIWRAPECIGFSEIDKYATKIYQQHFPNHQNYGDITKINEATLPDFDLLVGGFPCQSFSIAGRRRGFEDTRGTLFFDIARIVRKKQPSLLLLENVKGLLSHDEGRTFSIIISTLDGLGYDLQWQVLNSKDFGVPQNRERVFIVGHLRGTPRPEVFPLRESNPNNIREVTQLVPQAQRVYAENGLSPTLDTATGGNRQPKIIQRGRGKAKWTENEICPTITKKFQDNHTLNALRRLTPVECERLQGFPDGWTEGVSDTRRYYAIGNAVTVNVIRDVFVKML